MNLNNTYFGEVSWKHSNNGLNGAPLGPGGTNLPIEDSAYDINFQIAFQQIFRLITY